MKGIIVAAGYGTRFLPATKTLPKEMLPLLDKPAAAFIVEEFINSGIKDIIIVTSRRKAALDNYFDREMELEAAFEREGAVKKLQAIAPYKDANICYVRQQNMAGSGDAILQAAPWLGGEAAVVAFPDDIHFGEKPLAKQLIEAHSQSGNCICATMHVKGDVSRYGVCALGADGKSVTGFVEKPAPGQEPSHEVSIGRFLFTPTYFKALAEGWQKHNPAQGEFYHIYGLNEMVKQNSVEICQFSGMRLDTGEPGGYLEAILHYAAANPAYAPTLEKFKLKG